MPGIGVISNKNARLNRLNPKLKDRMAFIVGSDGDVHSTGTLDDAKKAAEEFKRCDIDMVAISGGDGTAHRTIELMIQVYGQQDLPPVLLLPTGTQNMVPASFGIRGGGFATLLLALARYRHNVPMRSIRRNMLKVNGHYSFMFGLGTPARFLNEYYERGQTTPAGAAKLLVDMLTDTVRKGEMVKRIVRSVPMRIRVDNGPVRSVNNHIVFCSFVEQLPLRFRLFSRAGWDRNVFEMLMSGSPPLSMFTNGFALWSGSIKPIKGIERTMARTMQIQLDEPDAYTLDGDVYEPTDRFQISAGPELSFVVPGLKLRRGDKRLRTGKVGPWDMRFLV